VATFSEGEDTLSIPVTVYDTTTDDADLWVEKAHLILDFQAGTILLQEVQILLNNGNKTYVSPGGEGGETIHFPLPQGAANLQLMKGMMACCVAQTEKGFAYTRPVFPGVQEFFFSYELPYQSPSYTLSKEIAYPTSSLDVLVADVGVEVTAPGLTAQEPLSLQGRRYLHLTGQGLTPADGLTLVFNNLPVETRPAEPATTASAPGVLAKVVMGLGTVAVLLALAYPFLKRRKALTSRWRRVSSSPSWGPMEQAKRPCSASWPRCSSPPVGWCASPAWIWLPAAPRSGGG